MSRIGLKPIAIPEKVDVKIDGNVVTIKGPKGELTQKFDPRMEISIEDQQLVVRRSSDSKEDKALHGLTRSLLNNMIQGVTEGFEKRLEMVGVGYRALKKGKALEIEIGYSHPVVVEPAPGIEFEVDSKGKNNIIIVRGIDKQLVGQTAAEIRAIRPPEPYKGKGIKYVDEHIRRKVGKTG
ncbi:50S ribosomal protein L6 [Anoxybacter fermentans]|uniref:Large ribosomal subunit protein uL6 n=1 Tax=Anoxybacter fermentans TaxID=1323375 RepID=A0A3S9T2G1_9FIRM|nr:50S ribosomal protein L6 [Anoxybacter fermentans]AZR74732.1 50S ribosomal protein L6 [Anoxybacter fermentans]